MHQDGPTMGAGGALYPRAYHFFERLRIVKGTPKDEHRLRREQVLRGLALLRRGRL